MEVSMMFSRWANSVNRVLGFLPAQRSARRQTIPQRTQLAIEALEDRCLLSGPGSTFTTGPLVEISNPDPLPSVPPGFSGTNFGAEPYVAVNPSNPQNIAAVWMDHPFNANAASVTFDGGTTWQNVPIPVSQFEGGPYPGAGDPWVSFAPNGNLYASAVSVSSPELVAVNKSTDGGRSWSQPVQVGPAGDKPSITADPTNPNFVYATWAGINNNIHDNGWQAATMFARSTDGGQTWQPAQDIHDAPNNDFNYGHQIVVLPNGTLIDAFSEGSYQNNPQVALTLLRSTDHGQTWSAPIPAVVQEPLVAPNSIKPPNALVTDPDTGQLVDTHPMFSSIAVDPTSGNLYAVWIDARFSNFQYNSIALSMSADGGLTWSQPIQVNQTPNTVPAIDRQAWNPTVAVTADGTVGVTYYDFRNNTPAPGALTDYWLAFYQPSASAPATNPANWSEVRLTNTSFNLEQAPSRTWFDVNYFLGDYEGLAAAGKDFVAVWGMPDGSATNQEGIFFRRAYDPPVAAPSLRANLGTLAVPTQIQLAAATSITSTASPLLASPTPGSRSLDPAAVSVALSLSQLPVTPAGSTNPVLPFAQAPLLMPSLTSNLSPVGSSQSDSTAKAASDRVFANFEDGLSFARLADDLAGRSSEGSWLQTASPW
jgi:hypothetical protein